MKKLFLCFFLGSASLLSAASSSPTATQPAPRQSSNVYTNLEQDEKMIRKIQEVLTAREISKGVYIAFEYRNGEVVLMGNVEKEEDKKLVEENVKAIPGIAKVDSKIVVKPLPPPPVRSVKK